MGSFGRGWPVEEATGKDLVLVAGELGSAGCVRSSIRSWHNGSAFARLALYGARNPGGTGLSSGEVSRWRSRFDITVETPVDVGDADWREPVGVVTTLITRARFPNPKTPWP